ncbi:MAG: hypothetical protein ACR2QH_15320 [Geminicoccaceae bacterium]
MATFRELSTEIQTELGGDAQNDLSGPVDQAINDAIANFDQEAFGETYGEDTSITTIISEPKYSLPATVRSIDSVQYFFAGTDYPLTKLTWETYVDYVSQQTSQTGPSNWYAIFGRDIYLYPAPSIADTLTISGTLRPLPNPFVAPADDAATNFWTEDGRVLIKARTKWDLYANRLNDPVNATKQDALVTDYLIKLRARMEELLMVGYYKPRAYF